jgi:hypothetical protein
MKRVYRLGALVALALAVAPALRAEPPDERSPPPDRNERLRRRLQDLIEKRAGDAETAPSASAGSAAPVTVPAPSGLPTGPALELARKWAELASSRAARRARHRAALVRDFGARLQDPALKAELALHGKRLADLQRLEFLASNARSGAERDKLLERIHKLLAREAARHQQRLAKLAAAAPAPSAPPVTSSEAPR